MSSGNIDLTTLFESIQSVENIGESNSVTEDKPTETINSASDSDEMETKSVFSIEKLKGSENYHDWLCSMENLLILKGYSDCIEKDTTTASTSGDGVSTGLVAKEKDTDKLLKAKATLILYMEPSIRPHVKKCSSAIEIWHKIQKTFEDHGHARRIGLLSGLVSNKLENCASMETYIANVMNSVSKLENIGLSVNEDWIIAFLLVGLSEKYESFILGLGANMELTSDEIKMRLLESDQRQANGEALFTKFKPNNKKKNFKKKKTRKCFICDSSEHLSNTCPEKKEKETGKRETANHAFCAFGATEVSNDCWYIDSGATSHMTPNGRMLQDKQRSRVDHITAANNAHMKVECVGSVKIATEKKAINATQVLHVQDIAANLLSVSKIVKMNHSLLFDRNGCTIFDSNNEVVVNVKESGGVYPLRGKQMCMLAKSKPNAMYWHRRLGHVNYQTLMKMKKDPKYGIEFNDDDSEIKVCEICAKGKQCKKPFPKSEIKTTKPLELIHSDLMGPVENVSYGGATYMLTFVDDFSRMLFVYFLRNKSQVKETFIEFKQMIENQTEHKIKTLRTDNGGEYLSKEFDAFCKANGIVRQLTIPETPQQNGVAERVNRTIAERARCLLFDAGLEKRCWAEACQMATYLRNRTPTASLNFKSPIEVWTNEKANLSLLKLFGCPVMVHIPKTKRKKFDEKSSKMVFVGYDTKAKAYRCLNTETKKVIVSRDVVFIELSTPEHVIEVEEDESSQPIEPDAEIEVSTVPSDTEKTITPSEENEAATVSSEGDESTISSSANNTIVNDMMTTLSNNTSADDHFTDAEDDGASERDETFKTRAKVDAPNTPRSGSRVRKQYQPFQISHFALFSTEPNDATEALSGEEKVHWQKAMDNEMHCHQKNGTWQLVELPSHCKAIEGKWVYKRKLNNKGEILRYKARFVAKGYAQRYGRDYVETFSPVVRHTTIRYLIALAVKNGMSIYQMDAETAFLQGDLKENVYMQQAQGYDDKTGRVYWLRKAIYGLKQASRMWNLKLNDVLLTHGFKRSQTDPCVYFRAGIIVAVYVDDFIICYKNEADLLKLRETLHGNFNMKDIGEATSCVGLSIRQGNGYIEIDQIHYVKQVLERFGMLNCKAACTPCDINQKLSTSMWNGDNSLVGKVPYQELIGSLLYLSGATRPDIAFAVNNLSRFNAKHSEAHWIALKRVLRYLKGTIDMKLRYERTAMNDMIAYTDADWGSDTDKRRSCTGYVVNMSNGAISWCSQRQSIVALSTTEAEYISLSTAVREVIWLNQLAGECGDGGKTAVIIHCDNQSAIDLAECEAYRPRTKHIDIRFHHIREKIERGIIALDYIPTECMVADSLTKAVSSQKTKLCCTGMGQKN